jgi:biotin carboxylase
LKPVNRSASQGVIRANNPPEFIAAYQRIASLVSGEDIIVEDFLPGQEVALEGILTDGELKTLAIFDKPEPLDGPYFEETIYVTPSQHPIIIQDRLHQVVQQAANALGLTEGPVHAELRIRDQESTVNEQGPWLIELAARSIGGLCSRSLMFEDGRSLEELIISHALKEPIGCVNREKLASGVMMIPIPKAGILKSVEGDIDARALKHVKDLQISIKIGQKLTPLPEGKQYLGFIFAKAESPLEVQASLREAHSRLRFKID